jgi:quercetin dioxygenase-like cupin family protein
MLLDESNLGSGEVEIGILTFEPGSESAAHVHGSTEVFYVLEGQLEHIVNGTSYMLEPGMVGWVRAPDRVTHKVSAEAGTTRALVIWVPGGEAAGITGNWERVR